MKLIASVRKDSALSVFASQNAVIKVTFIILVNLKVTVSKSLSSLSTIFSKRFRASAFQGDVLQFRVPIFRKSQGHCFYF